MGIDIVLMILMIIAVFKGYRNGFIIAVFSFLAIIIGLAAAMKFSAIVAGWLKESTSIQAAWLPVLSFLLIMLGVTLLVRAGALFLQSAMELVLLGWLNKISGMILYAALYITVFSVFLFYAGKIHLIKTDTFKASRTYAVIQPWGPKAIGIFGRVIPVFKDLFTELSDFFDRIANRIK